MKSPWVADTEEVESGRRVGQLVAGKYRLLRLIGQGGMGEVYEAQHAVVGRRFAVKFLHPHLAQSGSALLRFRREAQAAGALENEHIAAVTDFDTADDGAPFLVMEYLVGESMGQLLLREGPLPLARVVGALLQVCRGLEVAHAAGIVHRDLKPDNLFIVKRSDGSELIKILDFGIAKLNRGEAARDITRTGATLGTPFYMAPEQARGEKSIGERADIYALGVILYELLSGQKPHPGDSYNSILAHILSQPVTPLEGLRSGLPAGFATIVERALSSAPEARQPSAAALAKELSAFAGREVTPIHSHFDLRAAPANAATLPTPDAHTVSLAQDEPAPKPVVAEPIAASDKRTLPRSLFLAPLVLLALAAAAVGLWQRARAAAVAGEHAPAALPTSSASRVSSSEISAPPTSPAVQVQNPKLETNGVASAGAVQALTVIRRPVQRPSLRAQSSAAPTDSQPSPTNPPRVKMDEKNPY